MWSPPGSMSSPHQKCRPLVPPRAAYSLRLAGQALSRPLAGANADPAVTVAGNDIPGGPVPEFEPRVVLRGVARLDVTV